jgi:hypothetical protein
LGAPWQHDLHSKIRLEIVRYLVTYRSSRSNVSAIGRILTLFANIPETVTEVEKRVGVVCPVPCPRPQANKV